tara:strand:+ start:22 stop:465 length:444 start_codon:yes stop_codon:yes gene_type:complete
MANPFDFSTGAVLTAAQLNAIGDATDITWNPSANWSGSFGVKYAMRVNDLVVIQFNYTLDATPSGTFKITGAPVSGFTTLSGVSGTGCAVDTSADDVFALCPRTRDSGANLDFTTNAHNDFATVTSSAPFSWASGDSIRTVVVYRAA